MRGLKFRLSFLLVLLQVGAFACGSISQRVYGGDISYRLDSLNPLTCSIVATLYFDVPDSLPTDSIFIDWGDQVTSAIYAVAIEDDTLPRIINGTSVIYKHVYEGVHTYASFPASGYYTVSPVFQYRLNFINNILGGRDASLNFYITATFAVDSGVGFYNSSPVLSETPVGFGNVNNTFLQPSSYTSVDGDSIVFELQIPQLNYNLAAPSYDYPDDYCSALGNSGNLSIDANGSVTWASPCQQGVFSISRVVKKYRNGRLMGIVTTDQNIFVSAPTGLDNVYDLTATIVYPNPAQSFIYVKVPIKSRLQIINTMGVVVIERSTLSQTHTIDVSSLSRGIYYLTDTEHRFTRRFIKE